MSISSGRRSDVPATAKNAIADAASSLRAVVSSAMMEGADTSGVAYQQVPKREKVIITAIQISLTLCAGAGLFLMWRSIAKTDRTIHRSEEQTSELQSRFGISYAVF